MQVNGCHFKSLIQFLPSLFVEPQELFALQDCWGGADFAGQEYLDMEMLRQCKNWLQHWHLVCGKGVVTLLEK